MKKSEFEKNVAEELNKLPSPQDKLTLEKMDEAMKYFRDKMSSEERIISETFVDALICGRSELRITIINSN